MVENEAEPAVSRETLITRYFPGHEKEISQYATFLLTEGIERGIIGPQEGERIWERHIFNSLPVSTLIPEGASVIDIGSGAGLPGIPLALSRSDISMTLIEPLQRRVDFLNEAVSGLNITVLRGRAQDFTITADVVTARAVAPLEKLAKMTRHLIKKGGVLLAIKGEGGAKEALTVKGAELHEIALEGMPLGRVISLRKPG
ncbi:MAG: 16S rRNA (guanine(527)-N(7))-methyltransferase RsmG [Candidatus Nanopelagicaceae bacterium]|nr:16S rRNA (guanine(527)-N(7))-methyltransferase RsmG [Candidatus Nanopelagicaceae bacterium]